MSFNTLSNRFEGDFLNGKRHGKGFFRDKDGKKVHGLLNMSCPHSREPTCFMDIPQASGVTGSNFRLLKRLSPVTTRLWHGVHYLLAAKLKGKCDTESLVHTEGR